MFKYLLYFLTISIIISSCSKDDETISPLNEYNLSVVSYFKEIALGFEFGNASDVTRRWTSKMKIFVGGNPTSELLLELDKILGEINDLSTTEFMIELVSDTLQSNFYIYFGSGDSYASIFPAQSSLIAENYGLFYIGYNGSNEFYTGFMYVDIIRANHTLQRHLLREELTQSLGLAKDSPKYSQSIFQESGKTRTTEYAQIDRDLIRLLYHPEMEVDLNENQVDVVLTGILLTEQ